jgi:hypothetical protein
MLLASGRAAARPCTSPLSGLPAREAHWWGDEGRLLLVALPSPRARGPLFTGPGLLVCVPCQGPPLWALLVLPQHCAFQHTTNPNIHLQRPRTPHFMARPLSSRTRVRAAGGKDSRRIPQAANFDKMTRRTVYCRARVLGLLVSCHSTCHTLVLCRARIGAAEGLAQALSAVLAHCPCFKAPAGCTCVCRDGQVAQARQGSPPPE